MASTWASTRGASPAPGSSITFTCMSCRAGAATTTSCRCSPTRESCRRRSSSPTRRCGVSLADAPVVVPGIFKAYDVRGLYGTDMDEETAYLVGRGFARVLADLRGKGTAELRVGLGRDMRIEAPAMARRLRDGLVAEGVSVVDAGLVGTEMLYHLVGSGELDGGAMVTASHNPKAYTGVKLVREGALALSGDAGIQDI